VSIVVECILQAPVEPGTGAPDSKSAGCHTVVWKRDALQESRRNRFDFGSRARGRVPADLVAGRSRGRGPPLDARRDKELEVTRTSRNRIIALPDRGSEGAIPPRDSLSIPPGS